MQLEKYIDRIVMVQFLDHIRSEHSDEDPVEVTLYGELISVESEVVRVRSWHSVNVLELNDEIYTIIKSTVRAVKPLKVDDTI